MVDFRKLKAELYRIIIGVKYVGCEMKFARDLRQLAAELGQVVLGDAAGLGDVDDASFDGVCVGHGRFVVRQPVWWRSEARRAIPF